MNDEALVLGVEFVGEDAAIGSLLDISNELRSMQRLLDQTTGKAAKLGKQIQDMQSAAGQLKNAKISMPSVTSVVGGSGSGASSGGSAGLPGGALISRLGSMIGPEVAELAGLLGAMENPVALATAGVVAMATAAKQAAESLTHFKDAMIVGGGTAQETSKLSLYGQAVGVNNTAELARAVADRIATNGPAAAFAASAGVSDSNSAFSDTDKMKNLQKLIDHITDLPHTPQGDQDAARFARAEGLEAFLKFRDLSRETRANLDEASRLNAMAHTPEATKLAAEFDAQMAIAATNFDTLKVTLGTELLPTVIDAVKLFNDFAPAINDTLKAAKPLVEMLMMSTPLGMMAELHRMIERTREALKGPADDKKASEKEHTDAMKEHSRALKEGVYGGGQRAHGAVPSAWAGFGPSSAQSFGAGRTALLGAFVL